MDRLRDGLLARLRSNPKAEMPFLDHLEELRWRILWSLGALVIGTGAGMAMVHYLDVLLLFIRPAQTILGDDFQLIYLAPTDSFFFFLQLSVTVGVVLAFPVIFYQGWVFLSPALEKREKRAIIPALWMGIILFAGGVILAYVFALPLCLRFLAGFQSDFLDPFYTATGYFRFVVRLLLAFGAIFELPVVVLVLSTLGLVSPTFLRSKRRYAIVAILIVACLLSPGDYLGVTALMMVPMLILYEFSILLSVLVWRGRLRREHEGEQASAAPEDSVPADEPGDDEPEPTPYDHGDPAGGSAPAAPEDEE